MLEVTEVRNGILYTDGWIAGKRIRRSTGLKADAPKAVIAKRLAEIEAEVASKLEAAEAEKKTLKGVTFREVAELYRTRSDGCSVSSVGYVKKFVRYFGDTSMTEINAMTIEQAKRDLYYDKSKDEYRVSSATINKEMRMLKAIINYGVSLGLYDPPVKIKVQKDDTTRFSFFSLEERDKLIEHARATEHHLYSFILLSFYTGARPVELFALEWADVVLSGDGGISTITLTHYKGAAKRARRRDVPLHPVAADHLHELRKTTGSARGRVLLDKHGRPYGLGFRDGKSEGSTNQIINDWHTLLRQSGVPPLRPYDMRHSFATHLRWKGVDLDELQKLLGHSSLEETARYARIMPLDRRNPVLWL